MNKQIKWIFLIVMIVSMMGCKKESTQQRIITVTILPQAYFMERLAGDRFEVHVMVPAGSSPESYDPAPSQLVELSKSEAYFIVGSLGFELAWKEKIASNHPSLQIIDCSKGIEEMQSEHDCSQHAHHAHSGLDPHIWSSPKTALIMIQNMYEAIVTLDPDHKDDYDQRYKQFKEEIEALDQEFTAEFDSLTNKTFLIYHPSLGYLAKDYGLTQLPIEFEGKEPTPKYLAELIKTAKQHTPKAIFIQPEFDKKNAQVMSETIGVPTITINPLSYEWEKELRNIVKVLCQ